MVRLNPLERQQLEIQINSKKGGEPNRDPHQSPPIILRYDPSQATDDDATIRVIAPNYADNSDLDFSKNAYIASGAGDDDYECFNFYRQRFNKVIDVSATAASNAITSASNPFLSTFTYPMEFVLLNGGAAGVAISGFLDRNGSDGAAELFTDAGMGTPLNVTGNLTDGVLWFGDALAESDAHALKSSSHSLYAASEGVTDIIPIWDRTVGYGQIGSDVALDNWGVATPLPINFVRAGVRYYFRILISQRAGTTAGNAVRLWFGIWDASTSQKRFLESSNLDLTVTPVGTTGSTTYKYRIIADLDDGTEIMSDEVTITNGNATLSTANYNRLTWENSTGVLNYRIYREKAGVVKRIFTIRNGGNDYNDYGTDEGETPVAMPTAGVVRPIAYKVSSEFELAGENVWLPFLLQIDVPPTYDSSNTTGRQWLRFGIEGLAGEERIFQFDRIMLSTSNGGWQRSSRDLALIASTNPSSLPGDDGGQGGGGIIGCFTLDTPITVCDKDGRNMREIAIGKTERGMYVFSGGNRVFRILRTRDNLTDTVIDCRLKSGVEWTSSPSERFITSKSDRAGTRIDELTFGDEISGWKRTRTKQSEIVKYVVRHKKDDENAWVVRTLTLLGGRTFCVGRMTGIRGVYERVMNKIRARLGMSLLFTKAKAHNAKIPTID